MYCGVCCLQPCELWLQRVALAHVRAKKSRESLASGCKTLAIDQRDKKAGNSLSYRTQTIDRYLLSRLAAASRPLMSRRGNRGAISDFGKACSSRREELRSLRRTEGDRTSVKKYDFEVLPIVFGILAVAFVFAWALDL